MTERNPDGIEKRPQVGIGILIHDRFDRVILGRRHGSHGAGEWAAPGGGLEWGETLFEAAIREALEETGLHVEPVKIISLCDELRYLRTDDKHFLDVGIVARYLGGVPKVVEPHKCLEWRWFKMEALPEPLMESTLVMLRNFRNRVLYVPPDREWPP